MGVMRKQVIGLHASPRGHWVGDGFPVRSLFSYDGLGAQLSPFLLLDYAGPATFEPAVTPRGVGEHPHRGFETVTLVYQGEVAHRDSVGNSGLIGPGDVQWMTAASGILHEEFHSPAFTRRGGPLEMVQLWVNLPAARKMTAPRYQTLLDAQIPTVTLPDGVGSVRVVAGSYAQGRGPAETCTPLQVWDVRLKAGHSAHFALADGHTAALAVLRGSLRVNDSRPTRGVELVVLDRSGESVDIEALEDTTLVLLSGEPIDEPIVGYGPFVMNSRAEIETAVEDFRRGSFGRI
jgi:redox-sensitive bicupin YhaK (pirin superfamily)